MRHSSLSFSEGHTADFRTSVSAAKNPVPGAEKLWWRELHLEAVAAECPLRLKSVNMKKWNQGWARPSRSNCSDHSAGASRKVADRVLDAFDRALIGAHGAALDLVAAYLSRAGTLEADESGRTLGILAVNSLRR